MDKVCEPGEAAGVPQPLPPGTFGTVPVTDGAVPLVLLPHPASVSAVTATIASKPYELVRMDLLSVFLTTPQKSRHDFFAEQAETRHDVLVRDAPCLDEADDLVRTDVDVGLHPFGPLVWGTDERVLVVRGVFERA